MSLEDVYERERSGMYLFMGRRDTHSIAWASTLGYLEI